MSGADSIKQEISKLLKEIETFKKESHKISSGKNFEELKKKMENDLTAINIKMTPIIKKLKEDKENLKKLEDDKIKLAIENDLIQQKIDKQDESLKKLEMQLKEEGNLTKYKEIE